MLYRFIVLHNGQPVGWVTAPSAEAAIQRVHELTGRPIGELTAAICATPRYRPRY